MRFVRRPEDIVNAWPRGSRCELQGRGGVRAFLGAGYSLESVREGACCSVNDLRGEGVPVGDMLAAGYNADDLRCGGYGSRDLQPTCALCMLLQQSGLAGRIASCTH